VELSALVIVAGHAVATIMLDWVYFGRWRMTRPPIGVMSLGDVLIILGGVVALPLVYLAASPWLMMALLALGALGAVYAVAEPVLHSRVACWIAIALVGVGEALALAVAGPGSVTQFAINNAVLICGVVGVSNLWAQSGLRARDAAILGGALTAYDLIATWYLPLMSDLFERLSGLPFAPIVGWPGSGGGWVGIGLGNLVVATVFPLTMRKAYGRSAGLLARITGPVVIVGILALGTLGQLSIFPVMAVLGPSMVIQHIWWARRMGGERSTLQYRRAEITRRAAEVPVGGA
jgi:hypothetical protein